MSLMKPLFAPDHPCCSGLWGKQMLFSKQIPLHEMLWVLSPKV